jgi:3-hydroxyisobutyrate dehydrogenase-like beta-hydroxyacid dehydrogenase
MKVGFLGLGNMGAARNLIKAGHTIACISFKEAGL